jgi:hypothetical protein
MHEELSNEIPTGQSVNRDFMFHTKFCGESDRAVKNICGASPDSVPHA